MKFYSVFQSNLSGISLDCYNKAIDDRELNFLYSYWYMKDLNDEKTLAAFKLPKGNIMIDSGAFTAWTKDISIDVDEYIDWLNKWDKYITICGQIDSIPIVNSSIKSINDCAKSSWENYLYMTEKLNSPEKLLYTFHIGENFKWLIKALEYKDKNGNHIPYLAFGGLVRKTEKDRDNFLTESFRLIKASSNPNIKVHGFGVGSWSLWRKFPFESCDSYTPSIYTNNGITVSKDGAYRSLDYDKIFKSKLVINKPKSSLLDFCNSGDNDSEDVIIDNKEARMLAKMELLLNNIQLWSDIASDIKHQEKTFNNFLF